MTGTLDMTAEPQGAALVLRLSGVLDHESSVGVADATELPRPAVVVLDLRRLELATAAGARLLDEFAARQRAHGAACFLVAEPGSAPARTLWALGADAYLPVFATVEAALEAAPAADRRDRPEPVVLAGRLAELSSDMLGERTVDGVMGHVVGTALDVIPHARRVSVTLQRPNGTYFTPVTTDRVAAELDDVQYGSSEGPCLDAADPRGPAYAVSNDLDHDSRWPRFTAHALEHGLGAVLSTALRPESADGIAAGALNVYSEHHRLTTTDRVRSQLLAAHASLGLTHAAGLDALEAERAQFQAALRSRDVIGQAKGIVMHRYGYDADRAFEVLRRASQDLNVKVADLARTLVTRHGELDGRRG